MNLDDFYPHLVQMLQKILSIISSSFMLVSPLNLSVFAQEENPVEQTENVEDTTNVEETPLEDVTNDVITDNEAEVIEETQIQEPIVQDLQEEPEETVNEVLEGEKEKVNYFYVGVPYLETSAQEAFVDSFGDVTENIDSMKSVVQKNNGSILEIENVNCVGELYHFKRAFSETESGVYTVTEIRYFIDNQEY